ncbi:hypothetical protein QZR43_09820 [Serratia marcescens]|uniref:hypothetical protein n=1 Tax=Serratia marcescens TaxID=615 RepID=UPI00124D3DB7|nr:hypothetical protein [Serratia marcescens]ELY1862436.1 hypothetical protein [Serratia marcescens]MDP8772881.1 hypothetical protein [Serratia marcescens]MDP8803287.1 hypothetical protein [Serratia marcescens]QFH59426.1 hypothetical protein FR888_08930 [Serratia marcescens]
MGRPRKEIQTPGQENQRPEENAADALLLNSVAQQPANTPEQLNAATAGATVITVQEPQRSEEELVLAARNTLLGTINEQGASIITKFEAYAFIDVSGHPLTNNLEFLSLVKKATDVATGGSGPMVTNEEGKKQPAPGKPVLTEHGWHVPG